MEIKYNYLYGNLVLKSNNWKLKKNRKLDKRKKRKKKFDTQIINIFKIIVNKNLSKIDLKENKNNINSLYKKKDFIINKTKIINNNLNDNLNNKSINKLNLKKKSNMNFNKIKKEYNNKHYSHYKIERKKELINQIFNRTTYSQMSYFEHNNELNSNFNFRDKNFIQNFDCRKIENKKKEFKIINEKKYEKFISTNNYHINKNKKLIKSYFKNKNIK